ncbi:MAG: hypothetical protein JW839_14160 [Candidatus Lokiarchaeota archaeon]|nr:hypothetical protein [Candidatus Lokiarchaeota archaeon]
MNKIPTLFERDWNDKDHPIVNVIDPECAWVIDGEGIPTRKWDGTAVLLKDGRMYKRYDRKRITKGQERGQWKPEPAGWISCEIDEVAGHWWGWIPVDFSDPSNKWYKATALGTIGGNDALDTEATIDLDCVRLPIEDGTYELCGPAVNGNPERLERHVLIPHGKEVLDFQFEHEGDAWGELERYLSQHDIEGIVWWHKKDDRKAKIKAIDFKVGRAASDPGRTAG